MVQNEASDRQTSYLFSMDNNLSKYYYPSKTHSWLSYYYSSHETFKKH